MSHALLKTLNDQRLTAAAEARSILDKADSEKRDLTPDEETAFDKASADIDRIAKRADTILESEKRQAAAEQALAPFETPEARTQTKGVGAELRSWLTGQGARSYDVRADPAQPVDFRVLTKGTATAGGNTVPTSFYNQLVIHQIEVSGVLQAGPTVLTTSSGENLQVPKTSSYGTASIVSEGGTIPASDPAFGQVVLGAYKYGKLLQISTELATDSAFDLQGFIAQEAGRALGNAFGAHLVTGTGSSQPSGILTGASVGATGAASSVLSALTPPLPAGGFRATDLIDLFYSVISPYRASSSCGWLMRDQTVANIRKLTDSTGQFLWQPSIQVGVPDTLLGKPIYTDPNMPAVGLGAKSVLFGDFSRYFVRQVNGVRFERSDDFAFNTDLITYRAIIRGDGALIDTTGAVKAFQGNAA